MRFNALTSIPRRFEQITLTESSPATRSQPPLTAQHFHLRPEFHIGLHHLALTVPSEQDLHRLAKALRGWPGVSTEFMPKFIGTGPRKHMMFAEPGGLRLELLWQGN